MFTLSIEHAISDFPTWKQAFDRFAEARERAGVRSHRIRRPVGDKMARAELLVFASMA